MSTKMKKGILRPFRYFSNIMDTKEQELQIGFPTDVKHVAHIGWDGPSAPAAKKEEAGAPSWMKDYHSAPLDSASFRSDRGGGSAAANPWASQEIVLDGAGLGDTSFRDSKSDAGGIDGGAAGDSPPSPGARRSRRNRSRGSETSSMDVTAGSAETSEKKEKSKKGTRKNRKKDKDKAAEDTAGSTCQDLPAVPKKSNRRKNKASSEGSGGASTKDGGAAPEEDTAPLPQVAEEDKNREL